MILTYKYRIKDKSSKKILNKYATIVNQVWNYCNAYQRNIEARFIDGKGFAADAPTHWMPAPEHPV